MYRLYCIDNMEDASDRFFEVTNYHSLSEAIDDTSCCAYEETPENLLKTGYVILNDDNQIVAMGSYQLTDTRSKMPVLVWHFMTGRREERFYEIEYAQRLEEREVA